MIQILQIAVSVIFFANKVFVLIGKRSGWLMGFIAAILACWYFFLLHLYVYTALEVGLAVLMGYGYIKQEKTNKRMEWFIRISLMVSMSAIATFAFQGQLTVIEFISSISMLFGTYFLTHSSQKTGWLLYAISHIFSTYIGYTKNQSMFADFQLASAITCLAGAIKSTKSRT